MAVVLPVLVVPSVAVLSAEVVDDGAAVVEEGAAEAIVASALVAVFAFVVVVFSLVVLVFVACLFLKSSRSSGPNSV